MKTETKKRDILVILRNRFAPNQKPRFFVLECDAEGGILSETPLKKEPTKAIYDEVWENDEGKDCVKFCHRIKRLYRH